ncbi:membrane integrity-associated transporter subunit PqiC [Oxalobacteraceae bacterium OM1]|nr:membrane integrity-associated transporter subunit PqiC [Oxalobacteraceae bacterium OM1]
MTTRGAFRLMACCMLLALAGCASAPATVYTLNPAAQPVAKSPAADRATFSVAVGPVRVPEAVDRPELVLREGTNRIQILELHRWSQPLAAEIAQALVTDLAARLPQARVMPNPSSVAQGADYRITVDVGRFDAIAGEAVEVWAAWRINPTQGKPVIGQSRIREAVEGAGNDAVVAAFARAVARIGDDLAASLSSLSASGRASKR